MNSLELHHIMVQAYSDEELNRLCFYHFRPVYDLFAAGMTRTRKIDELIAYCERRGELQTLAERVRQERPNLFGDPASPPGPGAAPAPVEPPVSTGDTIHAPHAQGFINRPNGSVQQQFGNTTIHHHYSDTPPSTPAPVPGPAAPTRPMRVFLSYAPDDRTTVQHLYHRLRDDGFQPWMDREDLLPGQDWKIEIRKAIRQSGAVVVCLSSRAVTRSGQFQREMKQALEVYEEQPEGTIYLIPIKLDACDIPEHLRPLLHSQIELVWDQGGYEKLHRALLARAESPDRITR